MDEVERLKQATLKALIGGMQPCVGESMHPDAHAIVVIAFRTSIDADEFLEAYVALRRKVLAPHELAQPPL